MVNFFSQLLESDFMPHGYCFSWRPDILWLHVVSDVLITAAYYLIPLALIYLVRNRKDLAFHWMFSLFGLFILSCGTTHLMGIWTLWHPVYRLEGAVKAVTALASLPTALVLLRVLPKIIALPSPEQLRLTNAALNYEIAEHREARAQIARLNRELEQRVQERTADLAASNQKLRELNRQLAQAELQYRQLFESNPVALCLHDPQSGEFLAVNPAAVDLYGYSEPEFLTMRASDLAASRKSAILAHPAEQAQVQEHVRKNGARIFVDVRTHDVAFGQGAARMILSINVTERKALEEQLRHSQKMEAVGRLAGGVAHDFNNLLTVILGYADVVYDRLGAEAQLRRMVLEIKKAAGQASALTGQLLAFSRKQAIQTEVLELNSAVLGMEDILRRLTPEDIEIEMTLSKSPCHVKADAGQLSQTLMNLVINARDAMPRGGKVTIETYTVVRDAEERGSYGVRPAGSFAALTVRDTGVGMDPETLSHIFEPFFTTKERGKGTGLGLSTVYGIVQHHGGWIDVQSQPGLGSTFGIYLPQAQPESGVSLPQAPRVRRNPRATILLAEDEPAVRALTEDVLKSAGHTVLSAQDGRAALQLAEGRLPEIDLLITDIVMPAMSGPELANRLTRDRPGLAVLYISGYTDQTLKYDDAREAGTGFLQKPFLPQALLAKVEELLKISSHEGAM